MEIKRAREMGFCFGVRRAIRVLKEDAQRHGSLETLGPAVHNQTVVDELVGLGIVAAGGTGDITGKRVAITSHGVAPAVIEELKSRGIEPVDATCPMVHKAQKAARGLSEAGFFTVIFGDAEHPEVKGILGWVGDRGTVSDGKKPLDLEGRWPRRLGIISQTTQSKERFLDFVRQMVGTALPRCTEIRIINTICDATRKRQEAAASLAREVELMIVVGDRRSANTRRLVEVCSPLVETHLVQGVQELEEAWLRGRSSTGVTAGASTPDEDIDEVVERLSSMAGGKPPCSPQNSAST